MAFVISRTEAFRLGHSVGFYRFARTINERLRYVDVLRALVCPYCDAVPQHGPSIRYEGEVRGLQIVIPHGGDAERETEPLGMGWTEDFPSVVFVRRSAGPPLAMPLATKLFLPTKVLRHLKVRDAIALTVAEELEFCVLDERHPARDWLQKNASLSSLQQSAFGEASEPRRVEAYLRELAGDVINDALDEYESGVAIGDLQAQVLWWYRRAAQYSSCYYHYEGSGKDSDKVSRCFYLGFFYESLPSYDAVAQAHTHDNNWWLKELAKLRVALNAFCNSSAVATVACRSEAQRIERRLREFDDLERLCLEDEEYVDAMDPVEHNFLQEDCLGEAAHCLTQLYGVMVGQLDEQQIPEPVVDGGEGAGLSRQQIAALQVSSTSGPDRIAGSLRFVQEQLMDPHTLMQPHDVLSILSGAIEALARQMWPADFPQGQAARLYRVLKDKLEPTGTADANFASHALLAYNSYRNPVQHELRRLIVSWPDAYLFALLIKKLLELVQARQGADNG